MRAIAIDEYGGSERLQLMELPIPEVGPNDVLIRVRAAGVNPADISIREGRYAQMMPLTFPAIMGGCAVQKIVPLPYAISLIALPSAKCSASSQLCFC